MCRRFNINRCNGDGGIIKDNLRGLSKREMVVPALGAKKMPKISAHHTRMYARSSWPRPASAGVRILALKYYGASLRENVFGISSTGGLGGAMLAARGVSSSCAWRVVSSWRLPRSSSGEVSPFGALRGDK